MGGGNMSLWKALSAVYTGTSTTDLVRMDASTNSLQILDYEHHEIHSGSHFFIAGYQVFGNNETVNFTVVTPAVAEMHMTFNIVGTGATAIEIYEGATVDAAGTAVVSYCNNRVLKTATGATIRVGDTFDPLLSTLTPIFRSYGGTNKAEGIIERGNEIILDNSETYVFSINSPGVSNTVSYAAEWYEHTPKH